MTAKKFPKTAKLETASITTLRVVLGSDNVHYGGINEGDKTPNHDGFLELEDETGELYGPFFVQIKKVPKNSKKFSLDKNTIDFVHNNCVCPFALLCVDVENQRILWRHITDAIQVKKGKKSITINFNQKEIVLTRNRKKHIRKWISILQDHKEGTKRVQSQKNLAEKSLKVEKKKFQLIDSDQTVYQVDEYEQSKYKKDIDKAKVLLDNEKHISAKKIYEQLIKKINKDKGAPRLAKFKVYTNLGSCFLALGDYGNAAKNFKIAFKSMEGESELAYRNMAIALSLEGQHEEGIEYIDCALKINETIKNINLKSELLRLAGKFEEAMKLYSDEGEENEN